MKNVIQNSLFSKIKRLSHRIVVDGWACYPVLAMFFLPGWVPLASARPQKTVVDVDSKSQLFIDQELVYDAKGVSFTLHPGRKVSDRPLVKVDQPCEGSHVQMYGSVLYDSDEKLFKMWYLATASDFFSRETTFYATSRDGIHWDKSHQGTIRSNNDKPHNAVTDRLLASVMKDPHDPDPARRYKMICYQYDVGYCAMVSPDGLSWKEASPGTILPISYVEDVICACWSKTHQKYVAIFKQTMPVMGRGRRSLWSSTSHDFVHWSKATPAIWADRRDDYGTRIRAGKAGPLLNYPNNPNVMRTEIYGSGLYVGESCLIAFPWLFSITTNVPKVGNQEGPLEVQLAVSHDLEHFQRPYRTPIIKPGQPGEWDSGTFSTAAYAFDHNDEVWLYYSSSNLTHASPSWYGVKDKHSHEVQTGIGLVKWRKDRFVSADGPKEGAVLTTVPIHFSGKRLEINANVKSGGRIVVELLDMDLQQLATWPASEPIGGDDLRHIATFAGKDNVADLVGKPLLLRFHLYDAQLYAFAFRD